MDYGYQTSIGAGTFINSGAVILDVGRVTIGADVQIGPNVQLLTPTHPLDPEQRRSGAEAAEPITIGDNVWLGGGVIVCPGVTIGQDTVVGAGAVVTRDLPPGVLAVGNPARVVALPGLGGLHLGDDRAELVALLDEVVVLVLHADAHRDRAASRRRCR